MPNLHQPTQASCAGDTVDHTTRAKIIEATAVLLGKTCRHAVSIRDIAREAGANSALVSYYFGGKEQLYGAVVAEQFTAYEREVVPFLRPRGMFGRTSGLPVVLLLTFTKKDPSG